MEVRDLDETVTREEVVAALCIALGQPDLGGQCRQYKRFGGVIDCGGPFNRGGRSELARARWAKGGVGELPHTRAC